jgi:hypothetical protein
LQRPCKHRISQFTATPGPESVLHVHDGPALHRSSEVHQADRITILIRLRPGNTGYCERDVRAAAAGARLYRLHRSVASFSYIAFFPLFECFKDG